MTPRTTFPVVLSLALAAGAACLAAETPADPAREADGRRILLLFDLYDNRDNAITEATAAARAASSRLVPGDRVGVATFTRAKGFSLDLEVGADRGQLSGILATLGGGRGYGVEPSASQRRKAGGSVRFRESESTHVLRQLAQLGDYCRSLEGPKLVLLFSDGFDDRVLMGAAPARRAELARRAHEHGAIWEVNSTEYFGSSPMQHSLQDLIGELRRGDCAVHAIDTGGLARSGVSSRGASGLTALAAGTGGSYSEKFNDIGEVLEEVLERTRPGAAGRPVRATGRSAFGTP